MKHNTALIRARQMRKNPTKAEAFVWEKFRRKQFHEFKFYRQFIIEHAGQEFYKAYYIVDFYCYEKKLIIELDGAVHDNEIEKEYDAEREEKLRSMGFQILRFRNEIVFNNWSEIEGMILERLI